MLKNWSNHFLSWIKVQSRGPFWDNLFLFFLLFNLRSAQLRVSLVIACMTRPYAVLDRGALIHNRRVDLRFLWLTYLLPPMLSSDWISMRTTILAAFDFPLLLAPSGALIATTTLSFSPIANRLNFNFKILTKPCAQSLNKSLALWPNLSSKKIFMILPYYHVLLHRCHLGRKRKVCLTFKIYDFGSVAPERGKIWNSV